MISVDLSLNSLILISHLRSAIRLVWEVFISDSKLFSSKISIWYFFIFSTSPLIFPIFHSYWIFFHFLRTIISNYAALKSCLITLTSLSSWVCICWLYFPLKLGHIFWFFVCQNIWIVFSVCCIDSGIYYITLKSVCFSKQLTLLDSNRNISWPAVGLSLKSQFHSLSLN